MDVTETANATTSVDLIQEPNKPSRKYAEMLPINLKDQVLNWFTEDFPTFDYSGFVVGSEEYTSTLSVKSNCILAGVPFFDEVFALADCHVTWNVKEGDHICVESDKKVVLATVRGPVRKLLLGKRIALNVLSRCTSIATQTRIMVDVLRKAGYAGQLAGTRKTTPGFRLVEKYGMMVGGAHGHHYDPSCITFLKRKHIQKHKSIPEAIEAARSAGGYSRKIAIKVTSEEDAFSAISGGADIIVLDALKIKYVKLVAWHIYKNPTYEKHFIIECNGGITLENVASFISNDISVISTSWIHQGVPHIDFSLKVKRIEPED